MLNPQPRGCSAAAPTTISPLLRALLLQRATGGTALWCPCISLRPSFTKGEGMPKSSKPALPAGKELPSAEAAELRALQERGSPWGSAAAAAPEVRAADSAIFIEVSWAGPISEKTAINVFKCSSRWLQLFITMDCCCSYNISTTERFMASPI